VTHNFVVTFLLVFNVIEVVEIACRLSTNVVEMPIEPPFVALIFFFVVIIAYLKLPSQTHGVFVLETFNNEDFTLVIRIVTAAVVLIVPSSKVTIFKHLKVKHDHVVIVVSNKITGPNLDWRNLLTRRVHHFVRALVDTV
jgi:hypothetical protein